MDVSYPGGVTKVYCILLLYFLLYFKQGMPELVGTLSPSALLKSKTDLSDRSDYYGGESVCTRASGKREINSDSHDV